jgi:hypothetical protein
VRAIPPGCGRVGRGAAQLYSCFWITRWTVAEPPAIDPPDFRSARRIPAPVRVRGWRIRALLSLAAVVPDAPVAARRVHLSQGTVGDNLAAIAIKLEVPTRAEARRMAQEQGWLRLSSGRPAGAEAQ